MSYHSLWQHFSIYRELCYFFGRSSHVSHFPCSRCSERDSGWNWSNNRKIEADFSNPYSPQHLLSRWFDFLTLWCICKINSEINSSLPFYFLSLPFIWRLFHTFHLSVTFSLPDIWWTFTPCIYLLISHSPSYVENFLEFRLEISVIWYLLTQ